MRRLRLLLLAPLLALTACLPTLGVRTLDFRPDAALDRTNPATLLLSQRVAASQFTSIPDALRRAPLGSLIVACWRDTGVSNFWGPCSHVTRKLTSTTLADTWPARGAGEYPISMLYERYAVIVLDGGVSPDQLPALHQALSRVQGRPYDLSNHDQTYYCSTLQNYLNRAVGQPDVVPLNPVFNMYVPAEALLQPSARVLWVGVAGAPPLKGQH